jgi:hypothetical protein
MVVLHTAPAVRPEDVLTALAAGGDAAGGDIAPSSPPLTTRLAQYWPGQRQADQLEQGGPEQGSGAELSGKTVLWR